MRIEAYLQRYEKYRNEFATMKKVAESLKKENDSFVQNKSFIRAFRKKERLLRHATARLEAAIARIGDESLSNYLICRYFYGFKNIRIAMMFSYCERHIYRIARSAKKKLCRELIKLLPKPRRKDKGKKYYFKNRRLSPLTR